MKRAKDLRKAHKLLFIGRRVDARLLRKHNLNRHRQYERSGKNRSPDEIGNLTVSHARIMRAAGEHFKRYGEVIPRIATSGWNACATKANVTS